MAVPGIPVFSLNSSEAMVKAGEAAYRPGDEPKPKPVKLEAKDEP